MARPRKPAKPMDRMVAADDLACRKGDVILDARDIEDQVAGRPAIAPTPSMRRMSASRVHRNSRISGVKASTSRKRTAIAQ